MYIKSPATTGCLNDNSKYLCKIPDSGAAITMNNNNNEIQNVNHYSLLIPSNVTFFLFMFLLIARYIALKLRKRGKPKERGFLQYVKENVLRKQNHKYAHCKKLLNVIDSDQNNGDRSNNC